MIEADWARATVPTGLCFVRQGAREKASTDFTLLNDVEKRAVHEDLPVRTAG